MTNIEIKRDFKGEMQMFVGDQPAIGAQVVNIAKDESGELRAIVFVPLKYVTFGEVNNVVPFPVSRRPPVAVA